MNNKIVFLFLLPLLLSCSKKEVNKNPEAKTLAEKYNKIEVRIPMRDGKKLFTSIYSPKDQSQKYPFLMKRTPYSVQPYGEGKFPNRLGPSDFLSDEGYIFVYQDVRGRWMSEGDYDNMRPHIPGNNPNNKEEIDESSDTYDTITWLLENIPNNNGKVGQWGISYPGHYTASALAEAHPALVASSPQAPISDFYFDDFHHNGAYLQSYTRAFPVFGHQTEPTKKSWYTEQMDRFKSVKGHDTDLMQFYDNSGLVSEYKEKFFKDNFFWDQVVEHPDYDEFWQKRNILPHLRDIDHAVMTVGGWFDAEDLYGPLNIYKEIEKHNPKAKNTIVMGPWSHGDWYRERGIQKVNHIYYGDSLSTAYQKNVELPFFNHYLKGKGKGNFPEALLFDTGTNQWKNYDTWPSKEIDSLTLSFGSNGSLLLNKKGDPKEIFSYESDPWNPVPFRSEKVKPGFTPRAFMTDDQRHASKRKDVLTFVSDIMKEDLLVGGDVLVDLDVAISTTDADFIVKIIDVYPENAPATAATPENIEMGGYQQLVRSEVFRGRYRNSFAKPEPFIPGVKTKIKYNLQDLLHTIKKGHKLMVQIHSTWYPYIDRNPQKYVNNIYKAQKDDFVKSTIEVYGSSKIHINFNK